MKVLGYLLLTAGFLGGAYSTALHTELTNWMLFVPAACAALVGVFLVKRAASGIATSASVLTANRAELTESLGSIVRNIDEMIDAGDAITTEKLREEIDHRVRNDLRRFASARKSLVHLFGLQAYADIMSEFAAGERYINRVWSTSADGYREESQKYLHKAAEQFREASRQLVAAGT